MVETWAIVELMGHIRVAGRVSEEEKFGGKLGRVDVPTADGGFVTQYFAASSVYRITMVTEEVAREVAKHSRPEPVHSWEFPKQIAAPAEERRSDSDLQEEDDDWKYL